MATALQLRQFGVTAIDATQIQVRGFSLGGLDVTQLTVSGLSVGGITPGLTASDNTPESGQSVVLVYGGAGGAVTWRVVTAGTGTVLTPAGTTCTALMPVLTVPQIITIGATDAGQTEKTIDLTVDAAVNYGYDATNTKRPYVIYYYP